MATTVNSVSPHPDTPVCSTRVAGYTSLVTGIVLVVLAMCLASGFLSPGIAYHLSAYMAAGGVILSLSSFAVAACLLDTPIEPNKAK